MVRRYQSGDSDAFAELYPRYDGMIRHAVHVSTALLPPWAGALEDALAEGVLGLVTAAERFQSARAGPGGFEGLARKVVMRRLVSWVRRQAGAERHRDRSAFGAAVVEGLVEPPAGAAGARRWPDPLTGAACQEARELAERVLASFPPRERAAWELHRDGTPEREIAAALNMAPTSAHRAIAEVRDALWAALGDVWP